MTGTPRVRGTVWVQDEATPSPALEKGRRVPGSHLGQGEWEESAPQTGASRLSLLINRP